MPRTKNCVARTRDASNFCRANLRSGTLSKAVWLRHFLHDWISKAIGMIFGFVGNCDDLQAFYENASRMNTRQGNVTSGSNTLGSHVL